MFNCLRLFYVLDLYYYVFLVLFLKGNGDVGCQTIVVLQLINSEGTSPSSRC